MSRTTAAAMCLTFLVSAGARAPVQAQASESVPTDFYTIEPCRAVDTRETEEGPLRPGVARLFTVNSCGVPLWAFAVIVNVTVVDANENVEISVFPGNLNPGTSTVVAANPSRPTRAALAVLPLATDGTGTLGVLGVFASGTGQAHLILDVTGYFDLEDAGSSEDPGGDDSQSTLGEPESAYDGDPQLLDYPELYPPGQVGSDPSYGYDLATAPADCRQYSGGAVTPIGVWGNSPRYLAYAGQVKLLVGASADVACHFLYTRTNPMLDKCNSGPSLISPPGPNDTVPSSGTHYAQVLTDLKNAGFNKTRLWVALGLEKDRENLPFLWDAQGYWRLDQKNQDYFNRIRAVVSKAKELGIFVEVTFFAPFEGPNNGFSAGPWSWNANKAKAPDPARNGQLTRAGFTSPEYAVIHDPRYGQPGAAGVEGAKNERMRQFQQNVIRWTIEELWCYDNVFWEIANEPEGRSVLPLNVADWQRSMIATVLAHDTPSEYPALTRRHLIAVQPFTTGGGDAFIGDTTVAIINGHYTQVSTDPVPSFPNPLGTPNRLNLGAMELARRYGDRAKVLGFNEGKITPLGGAAGTRSHRNGVLAEGPEAARAEAWEFLLNRGGILDHWGYLSRDGISNPTVSAIRQQLSALKTFMSGVPLARLRSSTNPPGWVIGGLGTYPAGTVPWDAERSSQRYWAALQTDVNAATGRWFLLYIHHSTRRCYDPRARAEREFTSRGCDDDNNPNTLPQRPGPYMALGGYDARVWTTPQSKRYGESLSVNLGTNPGTFDVFWINPANLQTVKQQAVAWKQSTCSLPGCIICPSTNSPCTISSPDNGYDFDILLKIVQR